MSARMITRILIFTLLAAMNARGSDPKSSLRSISDSVICQCGGCNHNLNVCPHHNCSSKAEMDELIQKKIAEGKDETSILQDLVLRYGVKVLASPPAKGFTLAVWILPGVALVAGLTVLIVLVRKWRKPSGESANAPSVSADPKVLAAVEEEMKKVAG